MGIWLFVLIVYCFIDLIAAVAFGEIAEQKGHEKMKYFWYCFWLGFIGYLMVVALPDRGKPQSTVISMDSDPAAPILSDELPDL